MGELIVWLSWMCEVAKRKVQWEGAFMDETREVQARN
jgi:hypothetical protein